MSLTVVVRIGPIRRAYVGYVTVDIHREPRTNWVPNTIDFMIGARQYVINGERRSYALLRPVSDVTANDAIRTLILDAYHEYVAATQEAGALPRPAPCAFIDAFGRSP